MYVNFKFGTLGRTPVTLDSARFALLGMPSDIFAAGELLYATFTTYHRIDRVSLRVLL